MKWWAVDRASSPDVAADSETVRRIIEDECITSDEDVAALSRLSALAAEADSLRRERDDAREIARAALAKEGTHGQVGS